MEKLSPNKLDEALTELPAWRVDNGQLVREYTFADFRAAMEFVNGVAREAEAAAHHPDIDIRYNKVRIALETHDAGGLTDKDVRLARTLDERLGH